MGIFTLGGLRLVEDREDPCRNGKQSRGVGVPRVEAVLGKACTKRLHEFEKEDLLQNHHYRAEYSEMAQGS